MAYAATTRHTAGAGEVLVTLDERTGLDVLCRIPDLATLLFENWLPTPLLADTVEILQQAQTQVAPQWVVGETENSRDLFDRMRRRWVCAVAVSPRIVWEAKDAGPDALHIDDVSAHVQARIWEATYPHITALADRSTRWALTFVRESPLVGHLDRLARRYNQRPSILIGVTDPRIALDFDMAVAVIGASEERQAFEEAQQRAKEERQWR